MGIIERLAHRVVKDKEPYRYLRRATASFSQAAEDLVLGHLFAAIPKGTYVDIGAYDPIRMSNTYAFYIKGWRGINVDANKSSIERFHKERPDDSNINVGVGLIEEQNKPFYIFEQETEGFPNSMNSFLGAEIPLDPKEIVEVNVRRLSTILEQNLDGDREIDFLNLDVEGFEMEVLQSNNWEKFQPKVMVIECLDTFARSSSVKDIVEFVEGKGYTLYFKLPLSFIFIRNDLKLSGINQIETSSF